MPCYKEKATSYRSSWWENASRLVRGRPTAADLLSFEGEGEEEKTRRDCVYISNRTVFLNELSIGKGRKATGSWAGEAREERWETKKGAKTASADVVIESLSGKVQI